MARLFCIPAAILLFAAFILNVIVTISLPYLPALDITRTQFPHGALEDGRSLTEIRFGIWTQCTYDSQRDNTCAPLGYAYDVSISDSNNANEVTIKAPWTRGLALHPLATVVSLLAFAFALSEQATVALVATLLAWVASLLTFVAFIIDLILFGWTKHEFGTLNVDASTATASGTWVTFVAFILLFVGGFSTCCGRAVDRRAQRRAADAAAVEAAHAKEAAEAAAAAHAQEKVGEQEAGVATHGKSNWASKFRFGKKAEAS